MNEDILSDAIAKLLPPEATYNEERLYWGDKKVSDVVPYIKRKKKIKTVDSEKEIAAIGIVRGNEIITTFEWDINDIANIKWDKKFIPHPDHPNQDKYFGYIIQSMLETCDFETVQEYYADKVGWHKITINEKDIYVFNTGEGLIAPSGIDESTRTRIRFEASDYVLKAAPKLHSEAEAFDGIMEASSLNTKAGIPILAFNIAALTKSIFRECGIPPKFALYIVALKDSLKTAYTTAMSPIGSQFSNTEKLVMQFTSTKHTVECYTNDYPDFPIIVDNAYVSESAKITKDIKEKFELVIQTIGDDIGKGKANKVYKPSSSISMTGEYDGIGNPSTIARYLTVQFGDELKKPENQAILHKYQTEKTLIISTFYYYFLQFVADNMEIVKYSIKDLLTDFREAGSEINISPKLKERYFILLVSYMLFLRYTEEKGFLTITQINELAANFSNLLMRLCHSHNKTIIEKEKTESVKKSPKETDYIELLRRLYNDGELDISKVPHSFGKHWCAVSNDWHLCIRAEPLIEIISKYVKNVTIDDVTTQLKSKDIIKVENGKNGKSNPKACVERKRCFNIKPEYAQYILGIKE